MIGRVASLLTSVLILLSNAEEKFQHCKVGQARPGSVAANFEQRLVCSIMDNYQLKFGRPVSNMSESVAVKFGLQLIQIYDLDEKNQVLVTNVWQVYEWEDDQLVWEPDQFNGIKDIRLPVKEIWIPDVGLYNHADTRTEEKREVMCKVFHNGTVIWRPMSMFKSTCQIDIRRFPYDEQICKMKFGSWTYDAGKVNLTFWKGAYYCLNMGMIAMSTVLCAIVVHIHYRGNGNLPTVLKQVFLQCLSRMLWIGTDDSQCSPGQHKGTSNALNHQKNTNLDDDAKDLITSHNASFSTVFDDIEKSKLLKSDFINCADLKLLEDSVKQIRDCIRQKRRRSDQQLAVDHSRKDWIHLSIVLDRCFFVAYLLVMIISMNLMFPH
ncbi:hypothetical protein ACOME3_009041 [Neoechinorhynchus agilis]